MLNVSETEAQRGHLLSPESHSQQEPEFGPPACKSNSLVFTYSSRMGASFPRGKYYIQLPWGITVKTLKCNQLSVHQVLKRPNHAPFSASWAERNIWKFKPLNSWERFSSLKSIISYSNNKKCTVNPGRRGGYSFAAISFLAGRECVFGPGPVTQWSK